MTSQSLLNDAITLASTWHGRAGNTDKAGQPTILHALRVGFAMGTEQERIVGVLHDVLEDTDCPATEIRQAFGDEIADALDCLTKRREENYAEYLRRVASNPLALKVKHADIADNSDIGRLANLSGETYARLTEKYEAAYRFLKALEAQNNALQRLNNL